MILDKIKSYLVNVFPTTPLGSKVIGLYYYCIRRCKKQNFEIEEVKCKETFKVIAVLIAKNEGLYLKEWLEYHHAIGIDHFIVYDNESSDNTKSILNPYIKNGLVSYTFVKGQKKQMRCYEDAVARYRNHTTWMAFIDADEFICLKQTQSLPEFLESYKKYAGVGINWMMFDCNGHESTPKDGFVTTNFTRCLLNPNTNLENRHIKTIANPNYIHHFTNPHLPSINLFRNLLKRDCIVTENFENISLPITEYSSTSKIQINHYFSKSKEEYLSKISRGRADTGVIRSPRKEDYDFSNLGTIHVEPDKSIINKLKDTIEDTYK